MLILLVVFMPALLMAIPFVLAWTEDLVVRPEEYSLHIQRLLNEEDPEQIEKEIGTLLEPVPKVVWQ